MIGGRNTEREEEMAPDSNIPNEIVSFCERCSKGLSDLSEPTEQVEYIRGKLPELLENKRLFADLDRKSVV